MLARTRFLAPTLAALGAIAGCSTPPSSTHASSNDIPSSATQEALVPLTRNLPPLATKDADVGHRDPSIVTAGSIYFKLSDAQRADRDALLEAVQNPRSPSYHKWLTVEDYAARFGARKEDIARVRAWLESQGLTIDSVSRTGSRIGFRAPGGQVEAAFHTRLDNFNVGGEQHYAMASAPMIPSGIAPVVLGLHGFHDFRPQHPQLRRPLHPGAVDPTFGDTALAPPDFEVLYNTAPLTAAGTTGKGVNLVLVGQTYITPSDLSNFRAKYNLTVNEVDVLVPNTGTQTVETRGGDVGESELDLEWASAVAPGANIIFVYTGSDTNFRVDDAAAYAIEEGAHLVPGTGNGAAQLISESYGGCDDEYAGTDADVDTEIASAANLEGITYLAASGDSGATGCGGRTMPSSGGLRTGPPADLPGVTGVGGTEFCGGVFMGAPAGCFYTSSASVNVQTAPWFVNHSAVEYPVSPGGLSLEGAWNDSTVTDGPGGGGGGQSTIFPKPAYQQGVAGMLNDGARDVPDVALTASATNLGYLVWEPNLNPDGGTVDVDELAAIGGTSAATPSFAGILARVNQAVVAHGGPLGLGNVNPQLYALFANNGQLGAFHDIVFGDNMVPCDPTDQTDYPGCPMPEAGLPAGTDGGILPDGGAASSYGWSAHPGYDMASGLGTVDAEKLVTAWVGLTPTATALTAPPTATAGTPVTLTATITSTSASSTNPVGGAVTFAFRTLAGDAGPPYSFDAGGGQDESWVLGTVNVTPGSGSPATATATLSAAIPPGLYGQATLVAEYSGDLHYLASNSPLASPVGVTGSTLAGLPAAITLAPNQQTTFTLTGGAPPLTWQSLGADTTCLRVKGKGEFCSNYESTSPSSLAFQAGGQDGTITLEAIDTLGEEAVIVITVAGDAIDGGDLPNVDDAGPNGGPSNPPIPYWDGGEPTVDAGTWGFPEAGTDASTPLIDGGGPITTPVDSGAPSNGDTGSNGSSGCGCVVAGGSTNESTGASVGGLLLGLAFIGRRRNKRGAA